MINIIYYIKMMVLIKGKIFTKAKKIIHGSYMFSSPQICLEMGDFFYVWIPTYLGKITFIT